MPTTLTITTWNVQNLFRPKPTEPAAVATYDQKIPLLAKTIRDLHADVVALQEVGSADALEDLRTALGSGWTHSRLGVPDRRHIACAFLSKIAFEETADIVDFPPAVRELHVTDDGQPLVRMGRGALRVRIKKNGFRCHLIATHLKSKLLTFPPNGSFSTQDETLRAKVAGLALMRRTAEAATVRIAVNELMAPQPKVGVCVVGDFNDGPEAASTQIFQGPDGSELGTKGFDLADVGDAVRLWNLADAIDEKRRFSRIHRDQGELLDQIFVSDDFLPKGANGKRRRPKSVDSLVENIKSIGDNPNDLTEPARPDHAPVTAVFELG